MDTTINFIKSKILDFKPKNAIILGSGLGSFADSLTGIRISYNDIPKFQKSSIEGHKGQLIFTEISSEPTVIMQGRYHFYEGYEIEQVVYPIKVLKKLGVKNLIITNAAGAINKSFKVGDLMLITDHVNNMGVNPLRGKNDETLGIRFPDMSEVYSKKFINIAENIANKLNINIQKGVYCAQSGPSYETPAEVKMLSILGVDAVGMSTVPEAIIANYCGINILGISCLTNYAAGITNTKLTHDEVIDTANNIKDKFQNLIQLIIPEL